MGRTETYHMATNKRAGNKNDDPKGAPAKKRRVFLVDDHPIVRQGLAQLVENELDLCVCGQGEDAYGCLKAIRDVKPDLCIVDISLKDSDGLDLLKELKAQLPDQAVLILSMHDETMYAERALRAGARGYIMKQERPQTMLVAIRKVLDGQVYLSDKMQAAILDRLATGKKSDRLPMDRLTDRELEIFRMIGAGRSVKDIADHLYLSEKTVQAHREHIKEKLNFKSSAELLRFAIQNAPDARHLTPPTRQAE